MDLEVLRTDGYRQARPLARHGVEERAVDVDREGIAEFVGLGLVGSLPAGASLGQGVATERFPAEAAEDVGEGLRAKPARGACREFEPPAVALQIASLLQRSCQLSQLSEGLGRIDAREVSQQLWVDAREPVGIASAYQLLLHGVVAL